MMQNVPGSQEDPSFAWGAFFLAGLVISLLAAAPLSFLVLRLYRNAIERAMRGTAPGQART